VGTEPVGTGPGGQRAARQIGGLFVLCGAIGLVNLAVPGPTTMDRTVLAPLAAAVIGVGMGIVALPWRRWAPNRTLALVPLVLGLLAAAERFGHAPQTAYGAFFVVVFAWVGTWHAPRTSLFFAPLATAAYVLPFATVAHPAPETLRSTGLVIPISVLVGEMLASATQRMRVAQAEQEAAAARLAEANLTDELTGVGNRRRGNALLDSIRPGDALVVLDLDHFKQVNDSIGHGAGDRLLAAAGEFLRGRLRHGDEIARFGGDEFILVLRDAGASASEAAARLVAGWRAGNPLATLSAGVATHVAGTHPDATFAAADRALYRAKRCGRDQVRADGEVGRPELRLLDGQAVPPAAPASSA